MGNSDLKQIMILTHLRSHCRTCCQNIEVREDLCQYKGDLEQEAEERMVQVTILLTQRMTNSPSPSAG